MVSSRLLSSHRTHMRHLVSYNSGFWFYSHVNSIRFYHRMEFFESKLHEVRCTESVLSDVQTFFVSLFSRWINVWWLKLNGAARPLCWRMFCISDVLPWWGTCWLRMNRDPGPRPTGSWSDCGGWEHGHSQAQSFTTQTVMIELVCSWRRPGLISVEDLHGCSSAMQLNTFLKYWAFEVLVH